MPKRKPFNVWLILVLVFLLVGVVIMTVLGSKLTAALKDDDDDHDHDAPAAAPAATPPHK